MLFNSLSFAIFLPLVFGIYWLIGSKNRVYQNALLLVASYFFYACWDVRFLFLLIFSTLLDYFSGIQIEGSSSKRVRKIWFWLSIVINVGFLAIFKYYNFFIDSFEQMLQIFGFKASFVTLQVVLPVGISFYTFHGLSYVIDIYYQRISSEKNPVDYALFVSYFPLLVAGPIERATHLLPQIKKNRSFSYDQAVLGLRQILWGLFKKMVIADNCAEYVNMCFSSPADFSGSQLALGAVLFAFQIYGDFSGYSDIALGTSKLFGMELMRNFAFPYFSRDIAEFWRRWHISLSSWFRDYLYFPLGGSKGSKLQALRNTFIIFLVSGFWHGANWTFVMWGFIHALYFIPLLLLQKNRQHLDVVAQGRLFPSLKEFFQIMITFSLVCFAWIFFRAESMSQAYTYINNMLSWSLLRFPSLNLISVTDILLIMFFMFFEWKGRASSFAIEYFAITRPRWVRWMFYIILIFMIGMFMQTKETPFIYFQF